MHSSLKIMLIWPKTSIATSTFTTGGNIKAVQGDTGHSEADMVTNVYSLIEDESRKNTSLQVEEEFYTYLEESFYQKNNYQEDENLFVNEIKKDVISNYSTIEQSKYDKSNAFKPTSYGADVAEVTADLNVEEILSNLSPEQLFEIFQKAFTSNEIGKTKKGIGKL